MFTGHVYHTAYSISSICSSSDPCNREYLQQLLCLISLPRSCHGCKAIDADGVRMHSLARVPAALWLWAGRRVWERERDAAAQMCLCPDVSGSHPALPHSGMHLATQSKGWSMPKRYHGAALLWVKSHANPVPVYKVRLGLSGLCKIHHVNKRGVIHLLASKSTNFSTPLSQPSVLYPFAITPTRAGGCRHLIYQAQTPHTENTRSPAQRTDPWNWGHRSPNWSEEIPGWAQSSLVGSSWHRQGVGQM